jgi:8-oxo-dGTP pyrophosphatase MutT (NUDIX family)
MDFEPQKFFIGVIDFFSILMPGAMLVYLGKDVVAMQFGLTQGFPLNGVESDIVFVFASYLLGHFAFLVSAALLDDYIYDPIRRWTDWGQIARRLAKGKDLSPRWLRALAESKLMFGKDPDYALMQALRIKARAMDALSADEAINAFQWSKARLTKDLPEGLLTVQRFEADSKFFRSFVVVLAVLSVFYGLQCKWLVAVLCIISTLPALWRYIDQRFKSTQQAYWFLITLEAMKREPVSNPKRPDDLTIAGAVVYRRSDTRVEYLLVEATQNRAERLLPKGHIEAGEDPRTTAVREVNEETGHWTKVSGYLEDAPLDDGPNAPLVRWFLMELVEEPKSWRVEDRQHFWLTFAAAWKEATYPQTKDLLEKAYKRVEKAEQRN